MASRFAAEGSVAVAADTALGIIGSATIRCQVYYVSLASESAPADATIVASVHLCSGAAAGTATGVTPTPLDADDRVALCTAGQTYTGEPSTYVAVPLLSIAINQRSHYQFYAQEGGEFVVTSAADALIGLRIDSFSTGTPTMSAVMHWKE